MVYIITSIYIAGFVYLLMYDIKASKAEREKKS